MTTTPAIVIDAVTHRYGEREALVGVGFAVDAGELFGLLGPNGGGKTTLFKILATLLTPTSGAVRVFGDDVAARPGVVRRHLGVVFQSPALDDRLTVFENMQHHGHLYGLRGTALADRVRAGLAALSLADRAGEIVGRLSGGLKRRVEIAKALLPAPRVLVLDEPSTGLDPGARRELWQEIDRVRASTGTTIVLTTHLMEEAARCDRVAILNHGRLVASATPAELTATVGGDVLWISTPGPSALAARLSERFGVTVELVDGRLRIERPRGHEFLTDLIEAFPGEIDAVTLSRPTLDDAFVHLTGERFS